MPDHLLLETDAELAPRLRETLEKYVIADDVTLQDRSQELAALSVEGPRSGELLTAAGAVTLPGQELNHTWVELSLPGAAEEKTPVLAVRLSETGEEGYRLIFVVEYAQNVYQALAARRSQIPWRAVGWEALNLLRTEAGIPWYGIDMDEHTLPPEAGLEARAISYTKGCYLGQEIIERIRHVHRRLSGLLLRGPVLPEAGTKLEVEGKEAGRITTAVLSPTLGRPIGLGYVRREYREPGTRLEVASGGTAEVTHLPFYRRPS
jgi:folate-binding protein YgfZ